MINEIIELTQDIEMADALKRLRNNKDFKKIVQELFLDGGCINLTKNIVVVKDKDEIVEQIKSRGYLYRFLMEIENAGASALEAIRMSQEEANEEAGE